jgi:hypothetical protein
MCVFSAFLGVSRLVSRQGELENAKRGETTEYVSKKNTEEVFVLGGGGVFPGGASLFFFLDFLLLCWLSASPAVRGAQKRA